ncbi:lysine--tRNA ligase [Falsihalocynthiibacter sp. S25ZX9]|uniref:lysine--tRNA ligase n=1 Tax=Falsihalocynthiibacter sp. S25ZX9 TaxID=3240870 RepID=UPI00350F3DD3
MSDLRETAMSSKAWPFEEARRVLKRYSKQPPEKGYVLFQTGYGPSGLPHIGTFGEVARTTMVRRAFEQISDIPTKLLCFSDDMDGFRKVPTNVPMQEELKQDLNLPLTKVRDPFGTHAGFAQHNNARLCDFLDSFGFEYEFASSTEYYTSGRFDEALLQACRVYDKIMAIMLPTLGADRQATYSPFLPISPLTGHVLQVPMVEVNAEKGTVTYDEPTGERIELAVTGGNVKMQWKPDWAMRWAALGVDYEMSGKDLIDSVTQATKICRAMGAQPPECLTYELFNDELGQKISKSKGNGLSMEEWLKYAAPESLQYFMFQKPKTAKRLHFDVIPKAVDEYHQQLRAYGDQDEKARLSNPVYHMHGHKVPASDMLVPFAMLLNLASVSAAEDKAQMWGFIQRYAPDATPESNPAMDAAAGFAVRYYNDFVKPAKTYRLAEGAEIAAFADLAARLKTWEGGADADALQTLVFSVGKEHGFEQLRDWFKALYEVLLGASQGPRFGGFIALYGVDESITLIEDGLAGKLAT